MPKKLKHPNCTKGWCTQHIFELKPLIKNSHSRRIKKIRMCPEFSLIANKFQRTIPVYNKDKSFFTPSFMLEEEMVQDKEKIERFKSSHFRKVYENPSGISQIVRIFQLFQKRVFLVPNHGRKNKYCNVCRSDFVDYLEHIYSLQHKRCIRSSKFTGMIDQMAKKYAEINRNIRLLKAQTQGTNHGCEESTELQNMISRTVKKQAQKIVEVDPLNNIQLMID